MRLRHTLFAALVLVAAAVTPSTLPAWTWSYPATGIIGVEEAQLDPAFWVRRLSDADRVILDDAAIAVQNERMLRRDQSLHDLDKVPVTLTRARVATWINALSHRPNRPLYDDQGQPVSPAALDQLVDAAHLTAIPARQATRYGLVVQRADLRTFPTRLRVFSAPGDLDIDRFQESALFPGDPVVLAHESRDGQWWFVVSPRYAAWIEKRFVAEGTAAQVLGYGRKRPYRIVTGAQARTVYTPEAPAVSQVKLDMGVRVPVLADWPADRPVNGQHPYIAHVIELPVRDTDGRLAFAAALLPKREPTSDRPLQLTGRHLIEQGFKFLGERYGWGHSYDGRDCSGFVSEIYRSLGVMLPRNTGDQASSPALNRLVLTPTDAADRRQAALHSLQVGDLVFIPGHVMMVIGHLDGEPYVIHDTAGLSFFGPDGALVRAKTNGVTVSPLTPLLFNGEQTYVERITDIQRIRP